MNTYTQLSQEERYYISTQRARKVSCSQIAKDLGRATSTVTRELKRNLRPSGKYAAFVAHSYATARRRRSRRKSHFPKECWILIYSLLEQKLSPEQISVKRHPELTPERHELLTPDGRYVRLSTRVG